MKYLTLKEGLGYILGLRGPITFRIDSGDTYLDTKTYPLFSILDRIVALAEERGGVRGVLVEKKSKEELLVVWKFDNKEKKIPKDFWRENSIDEVYLIEGVGDYSSQTRSKYFFSGVPRYVDLKFPKSLFRKIKWERYFKGIKEMKITNLLEKFMDTSEDNNFGKEIKARTEFQKKVNEEIEKKKKDTLKEGLDSKADTIVGSAAETFDKMFNEFKEKK